MSKTGKWLLVIFSIVGLFALISIGFIVSILFSDDTEEVALSGKGSIAIIELQEIITSSENIVRQLKKYRENSKVDAIVLRIDSPGGAVSPSQEIFEEVKRTKKIKPVVVSMGSVAASGGYYIAIAASKIVANPGTITGSIGVISQFVHVTELMTKLGISQTTIKSGKFKDTGSPFRTATVDDKKYFQEMIDDVFDQFVSAVAEQRKIEKAEIKKLGDGRIFTGRKAYEYHLIDTLGTYEDAIRLAGQLANISGTPGTIRERKKERFSDMLFGSIVQEVRNVRQNIFNTTVVQYLLQPPQ